MTGEIGKIFPRNLTARAAHPVTGNPVISRPEDAVANCYPGLEVDVRNLDRRFFPGLVFNFVARNDVAAPYTYPKIYGAKLLYLDTDQDPELARDDDLARSLRSQLAGREGSQLKEGTWYIERIQQGGNAIYMRRWEDGKAKPLDGLAVWRLIRSLEPKPLTLELLQRDTGEVVRLEGWRRHFTDPDTGVISTAYAPGELTQGLCSPWQHDFRDCACNYWASNHPDIVTVTSANMSVPHVDWLRADRSAQRSARAFDALPHNRLHQLDHYQINHEWKALNLVIGGREIDSLYVPKEMDTATPFDSPQELAEKLGGVLAPLELTLTVEYLYARFSLIDVDEAEALAARDGLATLPDDVLYLRHVLMLVAVSEMQHLRWVNKLLWELAKAGLIAGFTPVLELAHNVPAGPKGDRPRALRRLEPEVLDDFIAVEAPSGTIDGAYARAVATLRNSAVYPPRLLEIAQRIVSDGVEHDQRFRDMKRIVDSYVGIDPLPYLRRMQIGKSSAPRVIPALALFERIKSSLKTAYVKAAKGDVAGSGADVTAARSAMDSLLSEGEQLARAGVGIPFWK
jgi:hypothetical protein